MSNKLTHNIAANVIQMAVSGLLIFLLYRYIVLTLDVESLGVWSVVLATASLMRLTDLGFGVGITKYVALELVRSSPQKAAEVVQTGILSTAVLATLILLGVYSFADSMLAYVFDATHISQASDIVPHALFSMWLSVTSSIFFSGLDGCQRMVTRAVILLSGQCLMTILAFVLMPDWGLMGLAWAQIFQGIFLFIVGWLVLRSNLKKLPIVPYFWSRRVFREIFSYSMNIYSANILMLFFDPLTKIYMAKLGGVTQAGYFEIANQLVMRVRSFMVAANQAIVPKIVEIQELKKIKILDAYSFNFRLLIILALPLYSLLCFWGGLFSLLITGEYNSQVTLYIQILALGWFANNFASPAYFFNMGIGAVSSNTICHLIMVILNLILGWVFGQIYGGIGVALGYSLALIFGSLYLVFVFQRRHAIKLSDLSLKENLPLLLFCSAFAVLSLFDLYTSNIDWILDAGWILILLIPSTIFFILLFNHPFRKDFFNKFSSWV